MLRGHGRTWEFTMEQFIDKDNTGTSTFEVRSSTKFAMVPRWIIRDPTLSHGAVRLYSVLMTYADNTNRAAFPSRKTIATDMGVSDRSITRFIKELEDRKILTVERRRNRRTGNFYANHYVLQFDEVAETNQKPPEDTSGTRRVDKIAPLTRPTNLITRPTSVSPSSKDDAHIPPSSKDDAECCTTALPTEEPVHNTRHINQQSKAAANDPLGPEWYYSQERQHALDLIQESATKGCFDEGWDEYQTFLEFIEAVQPDPYGQEFVNVNYWSIPRRCADRYEAAQWLNMFLNSRKGTKNDVA